MMMTKTTSSQRLGGMAAAIATLWIGTATAELKFTPYASGQYLSDSNVYRFSNQVADVTNTDDLSDRSQRYAAGLDTRYTWQRQKLHAIVEGREIRYDDFDYLDHDEYLLDTGIAGSIFSQTTGLLIYRNERRMASFEDRRSTDLVIERDQILRGEIRVAVKPDWYLVTGARHRDLDSPLPDAPALPQPPPGAPARRASPDFKVQETGYSIGVQYGIENPDAQEDEAPLLLGLLLDHQTVDFSGVTPQPPPPFGVPPETFDSYRLLTLQATVDYAVSGLTRLDGKLGATQYDTGGGGDSTLELTGEIGYTRRLSALTEIEARLFRRIAPFVSTADNSTDTGASIGVKWEPIVDLIVLADYSRASSSFRSLSGIAAENSGRGDDTQSASLSIGYPLFRYFGLRVFGSYNDRRSNRAFNDYESEVAGVELSFRWR